MSARAGRASSADTDRTRVAVIGLGRIAGEHLRYLTATPNVDIVGLADLSPALRRLAALRFDPALLYGSSPAMLAETRPDVVHVLTPPQTHADLAGSCLGSGTHVIVEKPAAETEAELERLLSLARANGVVFTEDHNYRFNRPFLALLDQVDSGVLGNVLEVEVRLSLDVYAAGSRHVDPHLVSSNHALPGGFIHDYLTHLAYLALAFVGDPTEMSAKWSRVGLPVDVMPHDDLDARWIDEAGRLARIRFTPTQWPFGFTVVVRGDDGMAEVELFTGRLLVWKRRGGSRQISQLVNPLVVAARLSLSVSRLVRDRLAGRAAYDGLAGFLDRTYGAIRSGTTPPVSDIDMRRVARLIDRIVADRPNVDGKGY
jgi:predicted dehydrogenase